MPRQQRSIQTSREGRLSLAIAPHPNNPKQSVRVLAAAYNVPKSTLQTRLHGVQPRSEILSTRRKLSPIGEQSLVQWILNLDRRGFPPHIIDVRRMADTLLCAWPRSTSATCWQELDVALYPEPARASDKVV